MSSLAQVIEIYPPPGLASALTLPTKHDLILAEVVTAGRAHSPLPGKYERRLADDIQLLAEAFSWKW